MSEYVSDMLTLDDIGSTASIGENVGYVDNPFVCLYDVMNAYNETQWPLDIYSAIQSDYTVESFLEHFSVAEISVIVTILATELWATNIDVMPKQHILFYLVHDSRNYADATHLGVNSSLNKRDSRFVTGLENLKRTTLYREYVGCLIWLSVVARKYFHWVYHYLSSLYAREQFSEIWKFLHLKHAAVIFGLHPFADGFWNFVFMSYESYLVEYTQCWASVKRLASVLRTFVSVDMLRFSKFGSFVGIAVKSGSISPDNASEYNGCLWTIKHVGFATFGAKRRSQKRISSVQDPTEEAKLRRRRQRM
jgi:hypothetical protein